MKLRPEQLSLAAGEISQELHARRDLSRRAAAAERIINGVVLAEGCIAKAPGTRFVAEARQSGGAGLMVGVEGRDGADSLVAVMDGQFVRFYNDRGVILGASGAYELALPTDWAGQALARLRWAQSNDVLYFCGLGQPRLLSRYADTDWRFSNYANVRGPMKPINTTATTITASAVTGTVTLTASAALFQPGHVGTLWRLDDADLSTIPAWVALEPFMVAGAYRRNRGNVYYCVSNASGATPGPNPPTHTEGDVSSGYNYPVWRYIDNGKGYVRITAVLSETSAQAEVVQRLPLSLTGGTTRWHEPAWSDVEGVGWPDRVVIFDQKICWGRGDELWITKPGDFYDFDVDDTDASAIYFRITPQGAGSGTSRLNIEWLLASGILVIGSSTGEYVLRGSAAPDAITATSGKVTPGASNGSAAHRPVVAERGVIFIGPDRRRLFYAAFDRLAETVDPDDLTLFARHILKGGAHDIAYQRDPNRLCAVRLASGELRFLTFNPKQEVIGWSRRVLAGGTVEAMTVIPGPSGTMQLWLLVQRTIRGAPRRYVEIMQPFFEPLAEDIEAQTSAGAWFVDSGLQTTFASPVTVLRLPHLAGQSVRVFADGGDRGLHTVADNGEITLDRPAQSVLAGVPIATTIRSLPVEVQLQTGSSAGLRKAANQITLDLTASAGGKVRAIVDGERRPWEPLQATGRAVPGAPQPLRHGSVMVPLDAGSGRIVSIEVQHDEAMPFTLAGWTPSLKAGVT